MREGENVIEVIMTAVSLLITVFTKYIFDNIVLTVFFAIFSCFLVIIFLFQKLMWKGLVFGILLSCILVSFMFHSEIGKVINQYSKEEKIYKLAMEYMNQNKFEEAIKEFNKLSSSNLSKEAVLRNFNTSKLEYKEAVFKKSENLLKTNKCSDALDLLKRANRILEDDSEIKSKIVEIKRLQVKKKVSRYLNKKKYVEAIQFLSDKIDTDIDNVFIKKLINKSKKLYIKDVLRTVDRYMLNKQYNKAEKLLLKLKEVVGDNSQIKNKLSEIDRKKPKKLTDFEEREISADFVTYLNLHKISEYEDVFGNVYSGMSLSGEKYSFLDPFYFGNKYLLNKSYKTLKGKITILNKYETGEIAIYNNGKEIYMYSFNIAKDSPFEIKVDVSDVKLLEIELSGLVLANATLYPK